MANEFVRNIRDDSKKVTKVFPAANANNNTDAIDLEQVTGGQLENIACELEIPALANHVDTTKDITIKLQDSADGTNFLDTDPLISTKVAGVATTGTAAKTVRFRLPPGTRRYIRLNNSVVTGGGDNTASSITFRLLF